VRQRKVASPRQGTAPITLGLSPDLRDSLKQLSAARKAATVAASKPKFIGGIVDTAIADLAEALRDGEAISFVPTPRSSTGRTALKVSAKAHRTAQKASEAADVKLADFVRTAISLYVRSHIREIDQKVKAARHRSRK
jgi:hypothetical protein